MQQFFNWTTDSSIYKDDINDLIDYVTKTFYNTNLVITPLYKYTKYFLTFEYTEDQLNLLTYVENLIDIMRYEPLIFITTIPEKSDDTVEILTRALTMALGYDVTLQITARHINYLVLEIQVFSDGIVMVHKDIYARLKSELDPTTFNSYIFLSDTPLTWLMIPDENLKVNDVKELRFHKIDGTMCIFLLVPNEKRYLKEFFIDNTRRMQSNNLKMLPLNDESSLVSEFAKVFFDDTNKESSDTNTIVTPNEQYLVIQTWMSTVSLSKHIERINRGLLPLFNIDVGWKISNVPGDRVKMLSVAQRAYCSLFVRNPFLVECLPEVILSPMLEVVAPFSSKEEVEQFKREVSLIGDAMNSWSVLRFNSIREFLTTRTILAFTEEFSDCSLIGVRTSRFIWLVVDSALHPDEYTSINPEKVDEILSNLEEKSNNDYYWRGFFPYLGLPSVLNIEPYMPLVQLDNFELLQEDDKYIILTNNLLLPLIETKQPGKYVKFAWEKGFFLNLWAKCFYIHTGNLSNYPLRDLPEITDSEILQEIEQ